MQKYALPCQQCKEPLSVETRHAGSSIHCPSCDCQVVVPKLRELKQLEPIQSDNIKAVRGWGMLSGTLFSLGLLLLVIAIGSGLFVNSFRQKYGQYTERPDTEKLEFRVDIKSASLTDSWRIWNQLTNNRDLDKRNTPLFVRAREEIDRLDKWIYFYVGLATVGLVAMTCSMLFRPIQQS